MIIFTNRGLCLLEAVVGNHNQVRVTASNKDVVEDVLQSIRLCDMEEGDEILMDGLELLMSKGTAALWTQFEILNYVYYTDFYDVLRDGLGASHAEAMIDLLMKVK